MLVREAKEAATLLARTSGNEVENQRSGSGTKHVKVLELRYIVAMPALKCCNAAKWLIIASWKSGINCCYILHIAVLCCLGIIP